MDRSLKPRDRARALDAARALPRVTVTADHAREVRLVATGAYSPLEGFLGEADYGGVLANAHLANGVPWSLPVTLDVPADAAARVTVGEDAALVLPGDAEPFATLRVTERFERDKRVEARAVFGTASDRHPGVARVLKEHATLLAGPVTLLRDPLARHRSLALAPAATRALFRERGWRRVAGYQTRNPPHRGHEFVLKVALALADGLLVHPVVGPKKPGDFTDDVVVDAYHALLGNHYPPDATALAVLPYRMRYAGPREAVHHAIVRKNHGCALFLVGRDHAGVGDYYEPDAAWRAFDAFPDLGIDAVPVRGAHGWCPECESVESERSCRHHAVRERVSGTAVRRALADGGLLPSGVMRPDVFTAIRKHAQPFVEEDA